MKYQALKRFKTKTKLLKLCDTLQEAHDIIKNEGAEFVEFSYMGGFPVYRNEKTAFNIQGAFMLEVGGYVVCSLNDTEKLSFNFK